MRTQKCTAGFTLVELSIVLVIIGLLVGGVLAGESLIHAAQLNSVTREGTQFITATQSFHDKYQALPGDMTNATQFWGLAYNETTAAGASGGSACWFTASATNATCDGDGNGQVNTCSPFPACYTDGNFKQSGEMFQYWKQLADAGLISGTYTGVCADGCGNYRDSRKGVNVPNSRYAGGGWSVEYIGSWPGSADASGITSFAGNYGNPFTFGAETGPVNGQYDKTQGPLITPGDAWNIDAKIDDGKPATGKVLVGPPSLCTNAISVTDWNSTYLLTSNAPVCALTFIQSF